VPLGKDTPSIFPLKHWEQKIEEQIRAVYWERSRTQELHRWEKETESKAIFLSEFSRCVSAILHLSM